MLESGELQSKVHYVQVEKLDATQMPPLSCSVLSGEAEGCAKTYRISNLLTYTCAKQNVDNFEAMQVTETTPSWFMPDFKIER